MTSAFDRWEKDPFFSAAEEVQESADRMESTYRTWIHMKKDVSSGICNMDELQRDLRTTLGTTKWQLEEFERAAKSSYPSSNSADESKDRHGDFISAIENQIKKVESSLNESSVSHGKPPLPWVRLDEGERNELALFLSGPSSTLNSCSRSSSHLADLGHEGESEERSPGLRKTASASGDIGPWKIMLSDSDDVSLHDSSSVKKLPGFSGFLNTMQSSLAQLKWPRNGYQKLNIVDHPQEEELALPKTQNLTRGVDICFEKSKSCLDGDCYDKKFYGWYGTIQRQIQRSQYHMQYNRPVQFYCLSMQREEDKLDFLNLVQQFTMVKN